MKYSKHRMESHDTITVVIDGKERRYAKISKKYRGYIGERNAPQFPANSFVMQSISTIIHFQYCLN